MVKPYRGARRSLLFVPADSEKKFQKALTFETDGIILDLEDSIVPEAKVKAREQAGRWLRECNFAGKERLVRVNSLSSGLLEEDIEGTIAGRPHTYVIPKINTAEEVEQIDRMISNCEDKWAIPRGTTGLCLIIAETPMSVLNVREIAAASPRITALTWGNEDLITAIGGKKIRREDGKLLPLFDVVRTLVLLAACSYHIDPLDAVYADFKDADGLAKEAQDGADMGYVGKIAIHPSQLEPINRSFGLSEEEIGEARELVEAFEAARANGQNTFTYKGAMVDEPHYVRAQALLKRASRINKSLF